jgi:hypothetical protein
VSCTTIGQRVEGSADRGVPGIGLVGETHARAEHAIEQQIAVRRQGGAPAQQQIAAQPERRGRTGQRAAEIRLRACGGDHPIGPTPPRVAQDQFDLAQLVAAERGPGQVFAFDPQTPHADLAREPRRFLDRRRQPREGDARQGGDEAHPLSRAAKAASSPTLSRPEGAE